MAASAPVGGTRPRTSKTSPAVSENRRKDFDRLKKLKGSKSISPPYFLKKCWFLFENLFQ
jgi:hypothetical protein